MITECNFKVDKPIRDSSGDNQFYEYCGLTSDSCIECPGEEACILFQIYRKLGAEQ